MEKLRPREEMGLRILHRQNGKVAVVPYVLDSFMLHIMYEDIKAQGIWWWWLHMVVPLSRGGTETRIQLPNHSQGLRNHHRTQTAWYLCQVPMATIWNKPSSLGSIDSFSMWLFFSLREETFAYTPPPRWIHSRKRLGHFPENRYPDRKWKS